MRKYVMDACALLALLRDEAGADVVAEAITHQMKAQRKSPCTKQIF